jgi:hypothetical protein
MKMRSSLLLLVFCGTLQPLFAADLLPSSLEGQFTKFVQTEEDGKTYTTYNYLHDGIMYWGSKDQMYGEFPYTFEKTGPNSGNLNTWLGSTKLGWNPTINISLTNATSGTSSISVTFDFPGHPMHGMTQQVDGGPNTYENLSGVPALPQDVVTGDYSLNFPSYDQSNWYLRENNVDIANRSESIDYDFQRQLPLDKDWSLEWVDIPSRGHRMLIPFAYDGIDLQLDLGSNWALVGFEFNRNFAGTGMLEEITPNPTGPSTSQYFKVNTASYDPGKESGFRVFYTANDKNVIIKFDESLTGNWKKVAEGSFSESIKNLTIYDDSADSLLKTYDTNYVFSYNGAVAFQEDLESLINADLLVAKKGRIYFNYHSGDKVSLKIAVGSDSLDSIDQEKSSQSQNILADHGADLGNGWRESDWFGDIYPASGSWSYHKEHGWIYLVGTTLDSIWYWDLTLGWCWTSQTVYPFVYSNEAAGWLYYQRESSSPRRFYDYAEEDWIEKE